MAARLCALCGAAIAANTGRPRKYCQGCAPSQRRKGSQPLTPVAELPESHQSAKVCDSVRAQLAEVGRESTPLGVVALALAEQIDAGGHTATGYAALAKQLEATLASAMDGTKATKSGVDELRERRERRRGA